jgi:flagellar biosynthesis/type III secretory pathway M-ring protein FliF/YscJ
MVDLTPPDETADAKAEPPATLKEVEEIIKRAVGFKPQRDEIKVTSAKLAGSPASPASDAEWIVADRWQRYEKIARHLSLGIAAIVALLLGRMILNRLQPPPRESAGDRAEQDDRARALEQLVNTAESNPEAVAQLLASWLDESETRHRAAA